VTDKQPYRGGGHLAGLRRFAVAITIFNIFGHAWWGFEHSYAAPLVSLATAYALQLLLDTLDAWSLGRRPAFTRGVGAFVDCLLSAHITGLATAMLLYANERLWVVAFTSAVAITSKTLFRAPIGEGKTRHFLNPSNFGIAVTLLMFPWVGIAAPYQATENLDTYGDWLLPLFIICTGSFLNTIYTKRVLLALAWVGGFALQAMVRRAFTGAPVLASLSAMTGVAYILFTFYMVTDPATTPDRPWAQIVFGASVAAVYGALVAAHIVYGVFLALVIVCVARGAGLYLLAYLPRLDGATASAPLQEQVHAEGVAS
jgi:enediyne biosynthesis protein E5